MSGLKAVQGGNPYFSQSLSELMEKQKEGKIRALGIVYLEGDKIHSEYVKSHGTSLAEILGATFCLQDKIKEGMIIK